MNDSVLDKNRLYEIYQKRSMFYTELLWKNFLAYGALLVGLFRWHQGELIFWLGGIVLLIFLGWFQLINTFLARATVSKSRRINKTDLQFPWCLDRYIWSAVFMFTIPFGLWFWEPCASIRAQATSWLSQWGTLLILAVFFSILILIICSIKHIGLRHIK